MVILLISLIFPLDLEFELLVLKQAPIHSVVDNPHTTNAR
ncbi:hypothetical protein GXM_04419 [Nostoc sphaeroides CCNUC1]|uniref:Uncharacterized protein n=1 Tax=Nostoc sphaeroides CCNUC1 TaxID=2653204 RepID=A0A5P8W2I6_9NOSO|nr:hypothetical protein GXM_04419 [Nostoc sphaeroides CCNUC1]